MSNHQDVAALPALEDCDPEISIVFKRHRLYQHRILRVNYTSYDVRRSQDVVNSHTSHCNIMVLCHSDDDPSASSFFRYARIIGTYHTNAIYTGVGRPNDSSHRMEFLLVRWYDEVGQEMTGWRYRRLNRLRLAPLEDDDTFAIIDPADVLRAFHIIPRFTLGKYYHVESLGVSNLANDKADWKEYYVNR